MHKLCEPLRGIRDDVMEQMKKQDMIVSDVDKIKHSEAKQCFSCNGASTTKQKQKRRPPTTAICRTIQRSGTYDM